MTKQAKVVAEEESAAAATLRPNPSRAEMLSTFTQMLAQLGQEDLTHFYNDAVAQIGQESMNIPSDAAAKNAATIAAKEDIEQIFGNEISEEFKEKAKNIFEALVEAQVVIVKAKLEEEFEAKMAEEAEAVVEQVTETLDRYLDYVASEWLKENEIAVEQSLRNEISESFLNGIYNLFKENNIKVPEEGVDVLEALTSKVESLEAKLDEEMNNNIALKNEIQESVRDSLFAEVAEGMVTTQVEKFRTLSEGIDYSDSDSFKKKLSVIKERHFSNKTPASSVVLTEENDLPLDEETVVVKSSEPQINRYVDAISRNLKN